jgi:hypothetical protein
MSHGRFLFKPSTIQRAIKAATASGLSVVRVEITKTGDLSLVTEPAANGTRVEPVVAEVQQQQAAAE